MPIQMSFAGDNFDVVTGATALLLAVFAARYDVPRSVVLAWNALGFVLLLVIVAIAVASLPWFSLFGPDRVNAWVLRFPYVWLPTVLVPAALLGHVLVFRKLVLERSRTLAARAFSR